MVKLAVFRRSNWLVEGVQEAQKMPRAGEKVQLSLKLYSNCATHTQSLGCVSATAEYQSGPYRGLTSRILG